jgi:hypothetical protein
MAANPQTSLGLRPVATRRSFPMRKTIRVVVTVRINPAAIIFSVAVLLKVLI